MGEVERGEVNVTVRTTFRIARALGMTLAELFEKLEVDSAEAGGKGSGGKDS